MIAAINEMPKCTDWKNFEYYKKGPPKLKIQEDEGDEMKTRQGFVSNSSTSSFVLLGWHFDEKEAREYVKKYGDSDDVEAANNGEAYEVEHILARLTNMSVEAWGDDYESECVYYVGRSIDGISLKNLEMPLKR